MKLSEDDLKKIAEHSFQLTSHNNRITGIDAFLVWQYVRHNKKYQDQYKALAREVSNTSDEGENDFLTQTFCSTWGIAEPLDFKRETIPKGFMFSLRTVRRIKDLRREAVLFDWNRDPASPEVIISINTHADPKLVVEEIEELLVDQSSVWDRYALTGTNTEHLTDNFICFHLSKVMGLRNKDVKTEYKSLTRGGDFQDKQIKDKSESFLAVSARSPWCFATASK